MTFYPRTLALTTDSLLPQSELTFRSALAGYESGKVDFATLLDAQRQIRQAKLNQVKAGMAAQMRLADIERIVGEDLGQQLSRWARSCWPPRH